MEFVSQLFVYPIKSLGGFSVQSANITRRGLQYDRRYMLVNAQNQFLTQRSFAAMALLQVAPTSNGFTIFEKHAPSNAIDIPFALHAGNMVNVQVWEDTCAAIEASAPINNWFSQVLQTTCKLVYMPEDSLRLVDDRYATSAEDVNSFSDGYPILLLSEASVAEISNRAKQNIPINQFRPNIVISGVAPFAEDNYNKFSINNTIFFGVKPCARCVVTTINQSTAIAGKEPLKTLATFRKVNNKILVGQNVIPQKNGGLIQVGNSITKLTNVN
jgi:uncharacterized protein